MARVVCPNCKTEFDIVNHDGMFVGSFHDCTDNVIGELKAAKINNANTGDKAMVNTTMTGTELIEMMKGMSAEDMVAFVNEQFKGTDVETVLESGFVRNSDFDLQHITAQTFKLLSYKGGKYKKYTWMPEGVWSEEGWYDGFRHYYSYDYTLKYLATITKRLAKLQKENKKMFDIELHFFNKDIICKVMEFHAKKVLNHLNSLPTKTCEHERYIKVGRKHYFDKKHPDDKEGFLFVKNIESTFVNPIYSIVEQIRRTESYEEIHSLIKNQFLNKRLYWSLNIDPASCSEWIDAFQGRGAFFSMQNLVRHSGVKLIKEISWREREELDKFASLKYLEDRLETDKGHYFLLMGLLKDTVKRSGFDFYKMMKEKYEK